MASDPTVKHIIPVPENAGSAANALTLLNKYYSQMLHGNQYDDSTLTMQPDENETAFTLRRIHHLLTALVEYLQRVPNAHNFKEAEEEWRTMDLEMFKTRYGFDKPEGSPIMSSTDMKINPNMHFMVSGLASDLAFTIMLSIVMVDNDYAASVNLARGSVDGWDKDQERGANFNFINKLALDIYFVDHEELKAVYAIIQKELYSAYDEVLKRW